MTAQQLKWIPSEDVSLGCEMKTDCVTNTLCYSMEYTPEASGILTSYTTGFLTDCLGSESNLIHNQSCVINDNSRLIDACAEHNKMLLNCSGNTGQMVVVENEPVILHQLCFQMDVRDEVELEVDLVTGITISLDIAKDVYKTSAPVVGNYEISTRAIDSPCDDQEETYLLPDDGMGLHVFPNPSAGILKVVFDDGGSTASLVITATTNQRVMSQQIRCGEVTKIDLQHLNPGSYIAVVQGEKEKISKQFIIIR